MKSGHEFSHLPNRSLIAQYRGKCWIFQNLINGTGFAINQDDVADQPDTMAVIRIARAMDRGEGLNRDA